LGSAKPPLALDCLYVTIIANFVVMGLGKPHFRMVYSPLRPLFLLLFIGLYLFTLPYATRRRIVELKASNGANPLVGKDRPPRQ